MYDTSRIKKYKKIGMTLIVIVAIALIYTIGFGIGSSKQKKAAKPVKQEVVENKEELTTKDVKAFLIAYYTKKDLGENKNRYKPLVTTALFTELETEEAQPVNQAYKGYVVNQVLDSADIYIDTENDAAITIVRYKNTQRTKKGNDDGALKNQSNQEAVKVSFAKHGKKYLADKMEAVTVTNLLTTNRNSYKEETVLDSTTTETNEESRAIDFNNNSVKETESTATTSQTNDKNTKSTTEESSHE